MAHYAEIDKTNQVLRVIVVDNEKLLLDGVESEEKGANFCHSLFGGNWIQTSYNEKFRKNFAQIGAIYDPVKDAFIPPKPFTSWILDDDTCKWNPPIAKPNDGKFYYWDEDLGDWVNG